MIAIATRLCRRITVFKWKDVKWVRIRVVEPHHSDKKAALAAKGEPVLPIFLCNKHYTTIEPVDGESWPEEWGDAVRNDTPLAEEIRAAGPKSIEKGSQGYKAIGTHDTEQAGILAPQGQGCRDGLNKPLGIGVGSEIGSKLAKKTSEASFSVWRSAGRHLNH